MSDGSVHPSRVRTAVNTHTDFGRALNELSAFFTRLQADPPSAKPSAGKPEQQAKSGMQQSSGAGTSIKTGKQQDGKPEGAVQSGKPNTSDTAGGSDASLRIVASCASRQGPCTPPWSYAKPLTYCASVTYFDTMVTTGSLIVCPSLCFYPIQNPTPIAI